MKDPRRDPTVREMTVARPDYIPEGQEHLYPHIGGEFRDYIPEGKTWQNFDEKDEPKEKPKK